MIGVVVVLTIEIVWLLMGLWYKQSSAELALLLLQQQVMRSLEE